LKGRIRIERENDKKYFQNHPEFRDKIKIEENILIWERQYGYAVSRKKLESGTWELFVFAFWFG
jgi:hypothetical protein